MTSGFQDVRYFIRMVAKRPGFTVVAAVTLALGIGGNSAIFSVVNAVLLRPLPFKDPARLIKLWETSRPGDGSVEWQGTVSVLNLRDWREQNDVFTQIAAYRNGGFNLQGRDHPENVSGAAVSANCFQVIGIEPALGRGFLEGEDQEGSHRVVVLGDALWKRGFGGDPQIINKKIPLNGEDFTVVGVMPAGFPFPSRSTSLWVPLVPAPEQAANRDSHFLMTIGRLKPGINLEQAREQMRTIAMRLARQYPKEQTNRSVKLIPLAEETVQNVRNSLLLLFGAVGFVLLIACTNVANLLLARASARRREIAIRLAVGAGRWRLIRQFLTESVMLSLLGGGLGLLLAKWGVDGLLAVSAPFLPRANEIALDRQVVSFTIGLSLLTGIVFGLAPALQFSNVEVQDAIKESGGGAGGGQRGGLRSALVVAEVAAAMVLLVGAGLLIKSFTQLQRTEVGLQAENVLTAGVVLPQAKYDRPQAVANFYGATIERISSLPGVSAAGAISILPIQQSGYNASFQIEGDLPFAPGAMPQVEYRTVTADYFHSMSIPVLSGRPFNAQDQPQSEHVAIINQTMARRHFGDRNPIGLRIELEKFAWMDGGWKTIVGVVGDVRQSGVTQPPSPEIYTPHAQTPAGGMTLVVRAQGGPEELALAVRGAVQSVDSAQPIFSIRTMAAVIADSISNRRLNMLLLGLFAAVALLLAVIGIYSVISYTFSQSTRELGIRVALGAQRWAILKLVIGQGLVLTLGGLVLGIAGALALTRLMRSLLYGVTPTDPLTFAGVSVLLVAAALVAAYMPARRATKIDPMRALRYE